MSDQESNDNRRRVTVWKALKALLRPAFVVLLTLGVAVFFEVPADLGAFGRWLFWMSVIMAVVGVGLFVVGFRYRGYLQKMVWLSAVGLVIAAVLLHGIVPWLKVQRPDPRRKAMGDPAIRERVVY